MFGELLPHLLGAGRLGDPIVVLPVPYHLTGPARREDADVVMPTVDRPAGPPPVRRPRPAAAPALL